MNASLLHSLPAQHERSMKWRWRILHQRGGDRQSPGTEQGSGSYHPLPFNPDCPPPPSL